MDVKQAVAAAKTYVTEVFSEEATMAPTLEEVWFDEKKKMWCITLGLRRAENSGERDWRDPLGLKDRPVPNYKVVRVADKDGRVESVKNREPVGA